jgi:thiol:disulfide interchange protein DsbD
MLDPVKWTTKIEKKSDNTYLLTFDGVIEKRLAYVLPVYS